MAPANRRLSYLRSRAAELARPETRAVAEPLATWARRRIRLSGRPFSFEGHAYPDRLLGDVEANVIPSVTPRRG